jgi:hypothetical protein
MTFARKLEIIKRNGIVMFEKGIDGIKSIEIVYENDRIIIEFDNGSEWDYKVITFNSLHSFQFSKEVLQSAII